MHCHVEGLVQGVFFRAETRAQAHSLGLTGWVRNLPDGRVEVWACGAPGTLDKLRSWLRRGPPQARVDKLYCRNLPTGERHADFQIRPG